MIDKAEKIQSKVEERERNETEITVRQQRRVYGGSGVWDPGGRTARRLILLLLNKQYILEWFFLANVSIIVSNVLGHSSEYFNTGVCLFV